MTSTYNQIYKYLNQLPEYVKQTSNIDELLHKLEKVKFEDKMRIINEINGELKKFLEGKINIELSNKDREKLKEIQEHIEQLKDNLNSLKKQVSQLSDGDKRMLKNKILTISEDLEEKGIDGKDKKGFWGFFRNIFKWIEKLFGGFGSSLTDISATFEKFGYGKKEDIEKVLKLIGDVKFKDLDSFYENLRKDKNLSLYLEEKVNKHYNIPLIPEFFEKVTDRLINYLKNFMKHKVEFKNDEQKRIATYIVFTLLVNKNFFKKRKKGNGIVDFVKRKIGFLDTFHKEVDNMRVKDLLSMMFSHGLSDLLRDYALPTKGVKMLNLKK